MVRLVRAANHLPSTEQCPIAEGEFELVWGLHASIFYIGVRKWIYGLPIPADIDADVAARVTAFLHGAPAVMRSLTATEKGTATARAKSDRVRGKKAR